MGKTIVHIVVGLGIWFSLSNFGVHWGIKTGALFVGVAVVHVFWKSFIFDPYLYLGAMPVANDDPLMLEAKEKAEKTFQQFLAAYPDHKSDAMVKFAFKTDRDETENLWGDVLEINGEEAKVYIRTPPVQHDGKLDRTQEISADQIIDWQVEFPDGTIRGGYTNRALFKIYEREEGILHPKLVAQLQRFRDLDGIEP